VKAQPLLPRLVRFLAAIAALCGVAAFPGSVLFGLQSINVTGNAAVPAGDILRRIGLAPGDSAFRVNAGRIRQSVLQDPRVEDAAVAMVFPHHVTISVHERSPVAALRIPGGYVLLGADGVVIARTRTPGPYLPLEVERLAFLPLGAGTVVPSARVRLGAATASVLPEPLRAEAVALRVDTDDEVVIRTQEGVEVRVGGREGMLERLALVPDVLAAVRARGLRVQYVDLRFPGSVIVKPVDASSPLSGAGPQGSSAGSRGSPPPGSDRQEKPPERGIKPAVHRPSIP
jgi:cell division protein FtsQ